MRLPNPKDFNSSTAISIEERYTHYAPVEHDDKTLAKIRLEVDNFDRSLENFDNQAYAKECLEIVPKWLWEETSATGMQYFWKYTRWDKKNQTMIVVILDYYGHIISYKRRKYKNGKWVTRWNTHPNRQCIMRIDDPTLPVFILEGHHDALSAMLLDFDEEEHITFNFIMIPTVGYTTFNDIELKALSGRDVFFLPDLGDKGKSIKGMSKLATQVEPLANHVRVVNLRGFLSKNNIETEADKLDLSEALFLWEDRGSTFIHRLLDYCHTTESFSEGEVPHGH